MATETEVKTTKLHTEVPAQLLGQLQALVDAGWFQDLDEVVRDALRRFVESHRQQLMEEFIREDIEWGLRGDAHQVEIVDYHR